jgi:hypothetical protein
MDSYILRQWTVALQQMLPKRHSCDIPLQDGFALSLLALLKQ